MRQLKGLIIDSPHIDHILAGSKTWEMRSTPTRQRGLIALIKKGSGTVIGVAELTDSVGPLSVEDLLQNQAKHLITPERLASPAVAKYKHAWVMKDAKRLVRPASYRHPSGAVKWVSLDFDTSNRILAGVSG